MWWTARPEDNRLFGAVTEPGAFGTSGLGGHNMVVMPESDIVVVHRVNTAMPDAPEVSDEDFATLLETILAARP